MVFLRTVLQNCTVHKILIENMCKGTCAIATELKTYALLFRKIRVQISSI
jgi:hypothetical protein